MRISTIVASLVLVLMMSLSPATSTFAADSPGSTVGAQAQGGRNATIRTSSGAPLLTWSPTTPPTGIVGYQIPSVAGFPFASAEVLPSPAGNVLSPATTQFTDNRSQTQNVYCYSVGVVTGNPASIVANSDVLCQRPGTATTNVPGVASSLVKSVAGSVTLSSTQTNSASLSWTNSIFGAPTNYVVTATDPTNFAPPLSATLPGSSLGTGPFDTQGRTYCYRVTAVHSSLPGISTPNPSLSQDQVCLIPGLSTLQPGATSASLGQATQTLRQAIANEPKGK